MPTLRTCSICGEKKLLCGFVYRNGLRYYCSKECLHHDFTDEAWAALYEESEADESYDCYWTEWFDSVFWDVYAVSPSGVTFLVDTFDEAEDARDFCKRNNWVLQHPEDGTRLRLRIRKDG